MTHLRTVRSFVRRSGRVSTRQQQALDSYWSQFGLSLQDKNYNFEEIFGRSAPFIMEIGFGMGHTLLSLAKTHPQNNYIGVEVHVPAMGNMLASLHEQHIDNIRVFNADAVEVLKKCIADNSLSGIHILFPDPWPKPRHHKRRLIQIEFLELLHQKLIVDGFVHLATDWQNYAEHMEWVLNSVKGFTDRSTDPVFSQRVETKFERRGKNLGHAIQEWVVVKA